MQTTSNKCMEPDIGGYGRLRRRLVQPVGMVLFLVVGLFPWSVFAGDTLNDQEVVLGWYGGMYAFSSDDEFRDVTRDSYQFNMGSPGMRGYYGEWYAWNRLGIGFRVENAFDKEVQSGCLGSVCDHDLRAVNIDNYFLTMNWVPLMTSGGYTRLVAIGGIGSSTYTIRGEANSPSFSGRSSTAALMAGLYVDWGGEKGGARLGFHWVRGNYGTVKGYNLDGAGAVWSLGFRVAFN